MEKIAGAKMRGPANFPKDTDWILMSVNIQTEIKSNELVAVATVWRWPWLPARDNYSYSRVSTNKIGLEKFRPFENLHLF